MESFSIEWKSSSERDLRRIDGQVIPRIMKSIESLSENPFPRQSRKLKASESSYRLRVGDYRVIYQVDSSKKTVIIYHIRHRRDVYKS